MLKCIKTVQQNYTEKQRGKKKGPKQRHHSKTKNKGSKTPTERGQKAPGYS